MKMFLTAFAVNVCGLSPTIEKKVGLKWLAHFCYAPFSLIAISVMVFFGALSEFVDFILKKTLINR